MLSEAEALATLRRKYRARAEDAAEALGWVTGGRGLHAISQLRLQELLWYALPVKWGYDLAGQRHAVGMLAELFTLTGMHRYAAICTSPQTEHILTVYAQQGQQAGLAAYTAAVDAASSVPPDTDLLAWGTFTGPTEHAAYEACAAALELADTTGELRPDQRGGTTRRAELVNRWLTQPRPDLGGDSWLTQIHTERLDAWTVSRYGEHTRLADQVAPRLLEPIAPPEGALPTLGWLLDHAHDGGIPLTARHYITPRLVAEAVDQFGWRNLLIGTLKREHDVLPLNTVHHLAKKELRAVRRTGNRLVLTTTGRTLHTDPTRRWQAATGLLTGHDPPDGTLTFATAARQAALLVLLVDGPTDTHQGLTHRVRTLVTQQGWQAPDEEGFTEAVRDEMYELRDRLWALDLLDCTRPAMLALTDTGQQAALTALRTRALRPRHHLISG